MVTFSDRLKSGTTAEQYEQLKLRYNLATACIENFKDDTEHRGRAIYSALSHLSEVPELEINMAHYDNLLFVNGDILKPEVFYFAESKLKELQELMEELQ